MTQLDFNKGKSTLATIDSTKIVAYLTARREFRVFNIETKQVVDNFAQVVPNSPPRLLVTSTEKSTKIAYTQNRTLIVLDLARKD